MQGLFHAYKTGFLRKLNNTRNIHYVSIKFAPLRNRKGAFFMLLYECKGVDLLNNINLEPNRYVDSYDNECFAPQFWGDDKECIVTTTPIPTKSV